MIGISGTVMRALNLGCSVFSEATRNSEAGVPQKQLEDRLLYMTSILLREVSASSAPHRPLPPIRMLPLTLIPNTEKGLADSASFNSMGAMLRIFPNMFVQLCCQLDANHLLPECRDADSLFLSFAFADTLLGVKELIPCLAFAFWSFLSNVPVPRETDFSTLEYHDVSCSYLTFSIHHMFGNWISTSRSVGELHDVFCISRPVPEGVIGRNHYFGGRSCPLAAQSFLTFFFLDSLSLRDLKKFSYFIEMVTFYSHFHRIWRKINRTRRFCLIRSENFRFF